jgi:hypothetical protein
MKKPVLLIALGSAILMPALGQRGQLYLIAGSSTPKYNRGYSTQLVAVGTDGSVKPFKRFCPVRLVRSGLRCPPMTARR